MTTTAMDVLGDPDLTDAVGIAMKAALSEARVSLPATVRSYDPATHEASVQPTLSRRAMDAAFASPLPVISRVPIVHPRTAGAAILLPIAPGDLVTLVFSDRALDTWKSSTGTLPVEPGSTRLHALPDCWAFIGGWPAAVPHVPAATLPGSLAIQVAPGTKVYIGNEAVDLLDLLDQFMTMFSFAVTGLLTSYQTHNHGASPANPPTDVANWVTALQTLQTLQTSLAAIKEP